MKKTRDDWIKDKLPQKCSDELLVIFEILMKSAYDEGYSAHQRDNQRKIEDQIREDRYGPDYIEPLFYKINFCIMDEIKIYATIF